MLFTAKFKDGIRAGKITATYRTWQRPQAKVGGRYNLHPDGVIEVTGMEMVDPGHINDRAAKAAGFDSAAALRAFLDTSAPVFAVTFDYLGGGQVRKPRTGRVETGELDALAEKLSAMDKRSETPWTKALIDTIAANPGVRAGDLAPRFHWETPRFKQQVRKLKALGLTISLETGYELSELGHQLRKRFQKDPAA